MFSIRKIFAVVIIISLLQIIASEQTFQKSGEHYHAKVTIHRQRQHDDAAHNHPPSSPSQPWRQGDRITKQEVIQNLAKALLTRKMTDEEKQKEKKANNAKKLHEYTLLQARQAKMLNALDQQYPNAQPLPNQPGNHPHSGPNHAHPNNPNQQPNPNQLWTEEWMPKRTRRFRKRFHKY